MINPHVRATSFGFESGFNDGSSNVKASKYRFDGEASRAEVSFIKALAIIEHFLMYGVISENIKMKLV